VAGEILVNIEFPRSVTAAPLDVRRVDARGECEANVRGECEGGENEVFVKIGVSVKIDVSVKNSNFCEKFEFL
jgi:hypothetical protein